MFVGQFLFKENIVSYKITVIPTSIGAVIGSVLYALTQPDYADAGPLCFGFIMALVCMGITKQAEWK